MSDHHGAPSLGDGGHLDIEMQWGFGGGWFKVLVADPRVWMAPESFEIVNERIAHTPLAKCATIDGDILTLFDTTTRKRYVYRIYPETVDDQGHVLIEWPD